MIIQSLELNNILLFLSSNTRQNVNQFIFVVNFKTMSILMYVLIVS